MPGYERPIVEKYLLELPDDRAADAEVCVDHPVGVVGTVGEVPVTDVHPAGERHPPVGEKDLSVVSEVDVHFWEDGPGREETGDCDAS